MIKLYVWIYVLENTDEVFTRFKEWKLLVEKSINRKLKSICTDNGGEYVLNEFQDFLRTEGVKHERSISNNSEQNRVAERMNRTLVETLRSMLVDSKLPKTF